MTTATASSITADFSVESWDETTMDQICDGVWTISDRHQPALVHGLPLINNRCFAFRLTDKDENTSFLVAIGVAGDKAIRGLQQLAQDKDLPVRFILSQGANHHMYLDHWYLAFPKARILLPGRKIPLTRNGKALQKKYPEQWEVYHGHLGIPALEKYKDQVDFAIFDQWYGIADEEWTSESHVSKTNLSAAHWAVRFGLAKRNQLMDAVWVYHKPSGICIYEHNVDIWFTKKQHVQIPFPLSQMTAAERFQSALPETMSWIEDSKIHYETWQKVLSWDISVLVDYHMHPGTCHPQTPEGARVLLRQLMAKSGEDDPTGYNLWYNRRNRQNKNILLVVSASVAAYMAYLWSRK
jgi:hypothetical protein